MVSSATERSRRAFQCKRFRTDGGRCTNFTVYQDGWCREEDCPGYTRPSASTAPDKTGAAPGKPSQIEATGDLAIADGDDVDFARVRINRSAVADFLHSHGGEEREARAQLRSMLEDFLLRSARSLSPKGFISLAHSGYELVLSPDGGALVDYRTLHRERTWAQYRAGVPSRFSGKRDARHSKAYNRPEIGDRPASGEAQSIEGIRGHVSARSIHLMWRVRSAYAYLRRVDQSVPDDDLDSALRAEFEAGLESGTWSQREDGRFELSDSESVWLVSEDGLILIGVKKLRS